MHAKNIANLFLLFSLVVVSFHLKAAPKSQLWPYWNKSNTQNVQSIDHSAWQKFLSRYVSIQGENNLVAYAKVTANDKNKLNAYIDALSQLDPRQYNKKEQYAYWVNLYNAQTVKIILDNYPIKSITKLGGVFSYGPWDEKHLTITGQELSLNDIEHRILRPIWKDYRTHYAVNCASLGCPNLQTKAFTAQNTESLLAKAEADFVKSNKGAQVKNGKAVISSIYDWYASDFGGKEKAWQYLQAKRAELKAIQSTPSYDYNWDLNQAR
ncbi:MAG: DUF547 domain-containing protein [Vibrio sp.]